MAKLTDVHQALNECIIERDALAKSHTALIKALADCCNALNGANRAEQEVQRMKEAWVRGSDALHKARKLGAEA